MGATSRLRLPQTLVRRTVTVPMGFNAMPLSPPGRKDEAVGCIQRSGHSRKLLGKVSCALAQSRRPNYSFVFIAHRGGRHHAALSTKGAIVILAPYGQPPRLLGGAP